MPTLFCKNISKNYGKVQALQDVGLSVARQELFGLTGPDGAGKTTLLRILASLLLPDSGMATVAGYDVMKDYKKIRKIIGYMPGKFALYQDLSVEENLQLFATLFNTTIAKGYPTIKDIYQQIAPFKKRRAKALSGGMKQKLALSCALIHQPKILLLDEPTTGVDPVSRKEFWQILKSLKEKDITVLVATAYMSEASLCDRVALMKDGHFIAQDTPKGIIASYSESLWAVRGNKMPLLLKDLRAYHDIKSCFSFGENHHITTTETFTEQALNSYLISKGHQKIFIKKISPTVEDCYMNLARN